MHDSKGVLAFAIFMTLCAPWLTHCGVASDGPGRGEPGDNAGTGATPNGDAGRGSIPGDSGGSSGSSSNPGESGGVGGSGTGDGASGAAGAPDGEAGGPGNPAELPAFCADYPRSVPAGGWESSILAYDADGKLEYKTDKEGNRIPDFSYAGYDYGRALPDVAEALRIAPVNGDNTQHIQKAIDKVGMLPIGANGYRGAVVLEPGIYELQGTIKINQEGVVLRGSGRGSDPKKDTLLFAPGTSTATRIVLGSGNGNAGRDEVSGTRTNITTKFVAVASRSFEVEDASKFAVGDDVIVVHPLSQAFLDAIQGGGTGADAPWTTSMGPVEFYRRVASKSQNTLTLDAPLFHHLNRDLTQTYVYKTARKGIVKRVGIENLRVDTAFASDTDENHAKNSIDLVGVEDGWARNITALHFVYAGFRVSNGLRVTVENCEAADPKAERTGGRMYNFTVDARAQLVLFAKAVARGGRHNMESNGPFTSSGVVFYRGISEGSSTSEGHRQWSQGLLWDRVEETGKGSVLMGCRGDWGTAHGWGTVHSVDWNHIYKGGKGTAEKPPTAQNYAIGAGPFSSDGPKCNTTAGHLEAKSGPLRQESLYEAQLCDRLRAGDRAGF